MDIHRYKLEFSLNGNICMLSSQPTHKYKKLDKML